MRILDCGFREAHGLSFSIHIPQSEIHNEVGGSSSVGRASAFQAECREFEPRLPLQSLILGAGFIREDLEMPRQDKEEIRVYNRAYYQRNRKLLLRRQAEKNKRFAEKRRQWLAEYKSNLSCARCGESHPATLTFHHRKPSEKSFEIGNMLRFKVGLKRLIAEIQKCEVLCAICHAKEHWSHLFTRAGVAQG